jgi:hypothetical protein
MTLGHLFVRLSITTTNSGGNWNLPPLEMGQNNPVSLFNAF